MQAAILAETARRSGSRNFDAFVKQAWPIFDTAPLDWNWHHDVLCAHLQEFAYGRIKRLRIHVPPRSGKTSIFAICWPAWVWSFRPMATFLYLSYSGDLSVEHSVKCRAIVESDWYRETFARGWGLAEDQNIKSDFLNTMGGRRIATSIGGKIIGKGGDFVMFDDPINEKDAHSPAVLAETHRVVSNTIATRLNNPRSGGAAMVMQRFAVGDPSSAMPDAEVLNLPVEFVPERRFATYHMVRPAPDLPEERRLFMQDPRTKPGELLHEGRWPKDHLDKLKLPPFGQNAYQAQYQQEPQSFEGGMFRRQDWRFYRPAEMAMLDTIGRRPAGCRAEADDPLARSVPLPLMDVKVIAVDAAFKDKPSGSRVAIHVWGFAGPNRYLLYRDTAHRDFVATKAALRFAWNRHMDAHRVLIEEAANGHAIIAELKNEIPKIIGVKPEGSKGSRAAAVQPYQQAGNCFLPDGADWLDDFVSAFAAFTPEDDTNTDDVDAFSHALRHGEGTPEGEVGRVNWRRR